MEEWQSVSRQVFVGLDEVLANIFVWFCLALAGIVILATVIGISSLLLGEFRAAQKGLDPEIQPRPRHK